MSLTEQKNSDSTADDPPLTESPYAVPVIYADGAAAVEIHGTIVRVTYYELRTVDGAEVRMPVLEMIRPVRTCGTGELRDLIERAKNKTLGCRAH